VLEEVHRGNRRRELEKKQMLALREEKEEMMRYVRGLDSTEQVPIGYAV
jgi:hypothetical protein